MTYELRTPQGEVLQTLVNAPKHEVERLAARASVWAPAGVTEVIVVPV